MPVAVRVPRARTDRASATTASGATTFATRPRATRTIAAGAVTSASRTQVRPSAVAERVRRIAAPTTPGRRSRTAIAPASISRPTRSTAAPAGLNVRPEPRATAEFAGAPPENSCAARRASPHPATMPIADVAATVAARGRRARTGCASRDAGLQGSPRARLPPVDQGQLRLRAPSASIRRPTRRTAGLAVRCAPSEPDARMARATARRAKHSALGAAEVSAIASISTRATPTAGRAATPVRHRPHSARVAPACSSA